MTLEQLKNSWRRPETENGAAQQQVWDGVAEDFCAKDVPSFENNRFLQLVAEKAPLSKAMSALDIGCGSGIYSFALAPLLKRAAGTDVSPKMIDFAQKEAKALGFSNTEFHCCDWAAADIDSLGFKNAFELVFAHMTPAICDFATLDKMNSCSCGSCFIEKPTRRLDSTQAEVCRLLGINSFEQKADDQIQKIFHYLWLKGYCPEFFYRRESWLIERPLAKAIQWHISRCGLKKTLTASDELAVAEYLSSVSAGGLVREESSCTVVSVFWSAL